MNRRWTAAGFAVCAAVALHAQTARPAFEVASVKRNAAPFAPATLAERPGGNVIAVFQPLDRLAAYAYRVDDFRVVGGPGWIRDGRFDINAKAGGDAPGEQLRLMMQSLLADRFALVAHKEQREMPIYSLVLAREDGRLGSGLQRVDTCTAATPPPMTAKQVYICGLPVLVSYASRLMGRLVVDKTGLTGSFASLVSFSTEGVRPSAFPGVPPPADPDLPSFHDALREQLGLKLEAGRGPVDVLVIDSVQQPTEN
jgi:uncharacterized protein (TIGR03435 family)